MGEQKLRGATRRDEYETLMRRAVWRRRRARIVDFLLGAVVLLVGAVVTGVAITGTAFYNPL